MGIRIQRTAICMVAVSMVCAGMAVSALGDIFQVADGDDITFGVSFVYDASQAKITVGVQNLSSYAGARVTGLAFNVPGTPSDPQMALAGFAHSGDGSGFNGKFGYDSINANGYGVFDIAACNDPNLSSLDIHGGTPSDGVATSAEFVFTLTGTGLDVLTEADFLSLTSVIPPGETVLPFVVRWQDADGERSGFAGEVVPLPSAILLVGIGAVCEAGRRIRRKKTSRS